MEGVTLITIPWTVFDVAIVVMLLGFGVLVIESVVRLRVQRTILWAVICVLAVVAWGTVFYGSFIEPKRLQVVERTVELGDAPEHSVRVAVISDYHSGPYKGMRYMERVVATVNNLDVDMVWSPGDFVFNKTRDVEMLESFSRYEMPVYASTGNHDHEFADVDAVVERLESFGVNVLRNESVTVESQDGGVLNIVGIDDIWFSPNPPLAFEVIDVNVPTIVIVHNPDFILDPYAENADLVVSGHTHGGQIRLPWIGAVPPLPTKLGRAYDRGVFGFGEKGTLFITQGVGETGPRARLFARPTIDVLNISY
ncbi:MAG: metallophosphoesterase [Patescibacteria group bacterium]